MKNNQRYKEIFIKSLSISPESFNEKVKYNEIPEWDSIGHMTLISGLEEEFKISIETDDILVLGSFEEGKKILEKYKISF